MEGDAGLVVGLFLLAGCLHSNATSCGDGEVCPEGTTCAHVTVDGASTLFWVVQQQLDDCAMKADAEQCTVRGETGSYHDQVCLADPLETADLCLGDCQ